MFWAFFPATDMLSAAKRSVTGEIQCPVLSAAAITKKVLAVAFFQSNLRFAIKNDLTALPDLFFIVLQNNKSSYGTEVVLPQDKF